MSIPEIDLALIAPEVIVTVFGLLVLLIDVFSLRAGHKKILGYLSLTGILLAFIFTLPQLGSVKSGYAGTFISDGFALVFPGGLGILSAVFSELYIDSMTVAEGAMRQGVLYDLLGRFHHKDMRDVTVAQFMQRYHVDALQARRVGALAYSLFRKLNAESGEPDEEALRNLAWAAKLHEIGISVAFSGYHKHSAYIVANADMPGFSRDEQARLAVLVQAHRRSLNKAAKRVGEHDVDWNMVFALRLAALLYCSRADAALPPLQARAQGLSVNSVKVWVAMTVAPAQAPVSAARPLGRSTAIRGQDRRLMDSMASAS